MDKSRPVKKLTPQELYNAMGFPSGAHGIDPKQERPVGTKVLPPAKVIDVAEIKESAAKRMEESVI